MSHQSASGPFQKSSPKPSIYFERLLRAQKLLEQVLWGKKNLIEYSLTAFLAGGHLLLEGPPGTGKTSLARGLSQIFGGVFRRIQMTSDLLPSDIVGMLRYKPGNHEFEFKKGPIFSNFLLADELNRTSPKTQSALLEAMAENTVTIDGVAHLLPEPFFVVATQNPAEFQGVYPLAESQLDRFMLQVTLDLPSHTDELNLYQSLENAGQINVGTHVELKPQLTLDEVRAIKQEISHIYLEKSVIEYGHKIIYETRLGENVSHGASVRAGIQYFAAAKAFAYLKGRNYVIPEDLKSLASVVLSHRICYIDGNQDSFQKKKLIQSILDRIEQPK